MGLARPRVAVALLLLAGLVACTRGEPSGGPVRAAVAVREPDLRAAESAVPAAAPTDPPSEYGLVGIFEATYMHRVDLVDLGARVVAMTDVPLAEATGSGPFRLAPALAKGLRPKDLSKTAYGMAGTDPGSTFVVYGNRATRGTAPEGRAYQLGPRGFVPVAGYAFGGGRLTDFAAILPWKDRGAVVVETLSVAGKDDEYVTTAKLVWLPAGSRPSMKLERGFAPESYGQAASRDGHLWLVGTRSARPGLWAAHVDPDGKLAYAPVPETGECAIGRVGVTVAAAEGERAVMLVEDPQGDCEPLRGRALFAWNEGEWRRGEDPLPGTELLAVDRRGTVWTSERGSLVARGLDGEVVRRKLPSIEPEGDGYRLAVDDLAFGHDGKRVDAAQDRGCDDTRMLVHGDDDRWLVRECRTEAQAVTAVFRDRAMQDLVVVRAPE